MGSRTPLTGTVIRSRSNDCTGRWRRRSAPRDTSTPLQASPPTHDWYEQFWQLADSDYIDYEHGSWWHELDTEGHPATTIWAGKGDLYHSLQATLFGQVEPAPTLVGLLARGR